MQDVTNAAIAAVRHEFAARHPDALVVGIPAADLQRRCACNACPSANTQAFCQLANRPPQVS